MTVEKSNEFSDEIGRLADEAAKFGIMLSSDELSLFQMYLLELWEWSRRFNLTGLKTPEKMVIELFLDSLVPLSFVPEKATLLDVGSGAGFPGLPLRIRRPRLQAHLLEANSKKVGFLRQVIRSLGLQGVEVIHGRIEGYGEWLQGEGYEVITARAVADLSRVLVRCAPLLLKGGLLFVFLGAEGPEDVEKNRDAMQRRGLRVAGTVSYVLPGKKAKRHTFILKREGSE